MNRDQFDRKLKWYCSSKESAASGKAAARRHTADASGRLVAATAISHVPEGSLRFLSRDLPRLSDR